MAFSFFSLIRAALAPILLSFRLSLIAYRLSLIAYRPGLCSQKYQYLSCYFDFPSHASLYGGVQVVLA